MVFHAARVSSVTCCKCYNLRAYAMQLSNREKFALLRVISDLSCQYVQYILQSRSSKICLSQTQMKTQPNQMMMSKYFKVKLIMMIEVLEIIQTCMQDTFARATHSAYAAGRPSAARDDRVSCIQHTDQTSNSETASKPQRI